MHAITRTALIIILNQTTQDPRLSSIILTTITMTLLTMLATKGDYLQYP